MLCALIGVERKAQLLDAAQALKLARVNEAHHQLSFISVRAQAYDVVHRIAINAFRHSPQDLFNQTRLFAATTIEALFAGHKGYSESEKKAQSTSQSGSSAFHK